MAYSSKLPHLALFKVLPDKKHVNAVGDYMNRLMSRKIDEVVDLPPESEEKLKEIATTASEKDRDFLLYTALYHDIGKAVTLPRHGAVGADIILHTESEERKQFYTLGFSRRQIYLLSNLIRFHDYLASVGTGETSYLAFAEALYPVSNMALIDEESCKTFFNYLLLTNLADVAGSLHKKVDKEIAMAIMHDFELINLAHNNISEKIYCMSTLKHYDSTLKSQRTKSAMAARNLGHIIPELKSIAEDHTTERLRRLLRAGFLRAIQNMSDLKIYKSYAIKEYSKEGSVPKAVEDWFIRDNERNDVTPIVASLNAINVKRDFYEKMAFFCKLDYELSFVSDLLKSMIEEEVKNRKKSPQNLRRDLAMTVVFFLNTLVELFGCLTLNDARIGMGFERMKDIHSSYKGEMLRRLAGEQGFFKQIEAMTAFKNSVNVWIF